MENDSNEAQVIFLHPEATEARVRTAVEQIDTARRVSNAAVAASEAVFRAQWAFGKALLDETLNAQARMVESSAKMFALSVGLFAKKAATSRKDKAASA